MVSGHVSLLLGLLSTFVVTQATTDIPGDVTQTVMGSQGEGWKVSVSTEWDVSTCLSRGHRG